AVNDPVWVIEPPDVIAKVLPTVEVPNAVAMLLVKLTALAPLLLRLTAPVNTLLCVNVIALAPALKLDVPGTVKIPVCVIAPVEDTVKFCPTDDVPNTVAIPLVKLMLFAPLLFTATAPVNALLCVKVIGFAPAINVDVPGTVNTPDCVIAPPAVADKLPLLVKVMAGNAIAALAKFIVKLRKLVKLVKLGNTAPALVLVMLTSRMLATFPPNTGAFVPRLLPALFNKISDVAAVTDSVVAPPVAV